MFILAVALVVSFSSGRTDQAPDDSIADHVEPNQNPGAFTSSKIAVLTATHNARWQIGSGEVGLSTGQELVPGQRIVLTNGFAQITTKSGAEVILQAPTSIELIEQANELRLVHGKLSATVPPAATGFTVHTPTASIIDLSTRFGVVYDGTTRAQVLQGEVVIKPANSAPDAEPIRLREGEGAVIDALSSPLRSQFPGGHAEVRRASKM